MREIEYRGISIKNSEWVYGYYSIIDGDTFILPINARITIVAGYIHNNGLGGFGEISNYDGHGWISAVDPETVGQFTGLLDKNGKKIFTGDIVKHDRVVCAPCDYHTGEPTFTDVEYIRTGHITITPSKGVVINGKQETHDYQDCKIISERKYNENPGGYQYFSEVIGNIHEHKDMLK